MLANGTLDGELLPDLELMSYYIIVATAGHDTTSASMAEGIHRLADNPDQLQMLKDDPGLMKNPVEEFIRLSSPVKHFMHEAAEDTEVGGQPIRKGDWLMCNFAAANLDPRVFDDPLRFDVSRPNADKQIAFGLGMHFCLGAQLARMEIRSLFETLVPAIESVEVAGEPATLPATFVSGDERVLGARGVARPPAAMSAAVLSTDVTEMEPGASRNRSLVGGIVGRVAPAVMRQIDTQDLVESLDVNLIAQELDLDLLVDRLDVNSIADRLDLDKLVDRLDVNSIADRLDLDKLVDRLDVNSIADRLDLDALVDRMDVNAIAGELDMAKLTAGATGDVALSGLDLARRQLIRVDATVEAVSDRVLRKGHRRPVEPGTPQVSTEEDEETDPNELQRQDVSGHYAGPVTNGLSVVGDIAAVAAVQAVIAWGALVWFGVVLDLSAGTTGRWLTLLLFFCVAVAWYWIPVALFGRTPAMAVMGVAVVTRDGGIVRWKRSLVRAVALPFSIVLPVAFIGLLVGKERRALHDVIAGTVVVYDWGDRDAERPVTIRDQFSAQARRRADQADRAA